MGYKALSFILVLFVAGTANASTFDFRDASTFGGAMNQPSYSAVIDGYTITATTLPTGARLWWDSTDGIGVQYRYENDEIEGVERLRISFSTPVNLSSVLITDLFNEGYLERGAYQLNGRGSWISFQALPDQTPGTNGELVMAIDSSTAVSSITFRAPGWLPLLNQRHEFSVAAVETVSAPVPIPGAFWLLGAGLVGLAELRRRMTK